MPAAHGGGVGHCTVGRRASTLAGHAFAQELVRYSPTETSPWYAGRPSCAWQAGAVPETLRHSGGGR